MGCSIMGCDRPRRARGYCSGHYQRYKRYGDPLKSAPAMVCVREPLVCVMDGCEKLVRRQFKLGLCRMHAGRLERHGDPNITLHKLHWVTSNGYIKLSAQRDHPLAESQGHLYEHRAVLYDHIGPGQHQCFWCAVEVEWEDGSLVVDHLDWIKTNNDPPNLKPSCTPCNVRRQGPRAPSSLIVRTCHWCGTVFVGTKRQNVCTSVCSKRSYLERKHERTQREREMGNQPSSS